jgi:hypothetical protein
VGQGFPAVQTVAFEQAGQQRAQRYLMRSGDRTTGLGNQGVINFAKVRLSEE